MKEKSTEIQQYRSIVHAFALFFVPHKAFLHNEVIGLNERSETAKQSEGLVERKINERNVQSKFIVDLMEIAVPWKWN